MSDTSGVEPDAIKLGEAFEGFRSAPYLDPAGFWSIGYGSRWINGDSVIPVTSATSPITQEVAQKWLANELAFTYKVITADVKVTLTHEETAALEDFIYNLGAGNFRSSTLLKKLNNSDYAGAAAEIDKWDHAGGKVMAGLLRRRQAETEEFEKHGE